VFRVSAKLYKLLRRGANETRAYRTALEEVHKRDKSCVRCGTKTALQVDHIVPITFGGGVADVTNLQLLCKQCHKRKSRDDVSLYEGRKQTHIGLWKFLYTHGRATDPKCATCGRDFVREYGSKVVYCSEACRKIGRHKIQRKYEDANKLKRLERVRKYRAENKEKIAKAKRHYFKRPDVAAYHRAYKLAYKQGQPRPKRSEFSVGDNGEVIYTPTKRT